MASLRKRYRTAVEDPSDKDGAVAATPVQRAEPPPASDAAKPAEPLEKDDPVEDAAASALKQRLREMERAEQVVQQAHQEPRATEPQEQRQEPLTAEQIIASTTLPDRAKDWLRQHPDYAVDPAKTNRLLVLDEIATRRAGSQFSDNYFREIEDLLGLRQQPSRAEVPANRPSPPRSQVSAAPVSAPSHREIPSMSNGRPPSTPLQLTAEEEEMRRILGLTLEEWRKGKARMLREKGEGHHQHG
jgi:hypothetical protein